MKKIYQVLIVICSSSLLFAQSEKKVITFINQRSASTNTALELAGWERLVNIYNNNKFYSTLAIAFEATKSFRPDRIAQCLFGDDVLNCPENIPVCCKKHANTHKCCDNFQPNLTKYRTCQSSFLVAGSHSARRTATSWLADYFGLPTDYESEIHVKPQINNLIVDFDWYLGFSHGLYLRIHAPVEYTKWNLYICEDILKTGTNAYAPGYFNPDGAERHDLVPSFLDFISGYATPDIADITFEPLQHAKMSLHTLHKTSFAEIQLALGWNFLLADWYHLGVNVRTSIPAGNKPHGEFLFEPMVGNGHHWEAGIGISGHVMAINHEDTGEQFMIHGDINLTSVLSSQERRSFDIKNKPNSRYMLAAKFNTNNPDNLRGTVDGTPTQPNFLFAGTYTPVANLTTLDIDVHVGLQVDLALMLSYIHERSSWNIGYGFWARSCEELCICKTPFDDDTTKWVLKGDAQMYGFMSTDDAPLQADDPVALSASQSQATVHTGTNFPRDTTDFVPGQKNPNIDNPQAATAGTSNTALLYAPGIGDPGNNQINTSINPIVLTRADIDLSSASARYVAQKLFMHFNYTLIDHTSVKPYFGFGAEIDFGRRAGCTPAKEVSCCINAALSYWGVWIKCGCTFR